MKRTCLLIFAVLALSILAQVSYAQGQVWQETKLTGAGAQPSSPKIWGGAVYWADHRTYQSGHDEIQMWDPVAGERTLTQVPLYSVLDGIYGQTLVYEKYVSGSNYDIYSYDPVNGHRALTTASGYQKNADIYGSQNPVVVWEDHRNPDYSQIYEWDPAHGERVVSASLSNQTKPKIFGDTVTWEQATSGTPHVWKWDPVGGAVDLGTGYSPAVYDGKVVGWQPAYYWDDSHGRHFADGQLWQWTAAGGKVNLAAIPWASSLYGCEMRGDIVTLQLGDGNPIWNLYAWDPVHGLNRVNDSSVYGSFPSVYGNQIAWVGGSNIYLSTLTPEPSGIAGLIGFLGLLGLVVRRNRGSGSIRS